MKSCDGGFVGFRQVRESRQESFKVPDRTIDATVPQTPFHGSDVPVQGRRRYGPIGTESRHMISDLLHFRVEDGEANDANVERSHASGGGQ